MTTLCHFSWFIKRQKSKPETPPTTPKFHDALISDGNARSQMVRWFENHKIGHSWALNSLFDVTWAGMELLMELTGNNDVEAAKKFHHLLSCFSSEFFEYSKSSPKFLEIFGPIARKTTEWPSVISMHKGINAFNRKLISGLRLGEDVKLNLQGNWDSDAPEFRAALSLISLMEKYRESQSPEALKKHRQWVAELNQRFGRHKNHKSSKGSFKFPPNPELLKEFEWRNKSYKLSKNLPQFNKNTYKQWFDASWPLFISQWKEDFENRKSFSRFIPIAEKTASTEKKKVRGVLRRYIKKRILDAFKQLAPDVDLKTKS